jgi:2-oxoisovalerate dehydrogenase E2 component (dihydrolipoyl transacylase)
MSEYVFKLPDLGEGTVEAEIAEWMVQVGDVILEEDPICAMLTEKAAVELTSPVGGRVVSLAGEAGDTVAVGSPLIVFETDAEAPTPRTKPETAEDHPAEPVPAAEEPGAAPTPAQSGKVATSPSIRARAREAGIDLAQVPGTGPRGRILKTDFEAFLSTRHAPPGAAVPAKRDGVTEIKVIGLRRKIAERMARSAREIPHFTYVEEVDVTALESLRQHLNAKKAPGEAKLTLLPFIGLALTRALREFPQCNAHYDSERNVILRHEAVHLGIATQTDDGLKVPVARHVEALSLEGLSAEIRRVSTAARDNSAGREELSGSTITITSLGKLGGVVSTPVINQPEVAIIGVNRAVERPVVVDGRVEVRRMMNLSSSFDHRFVDGYDAAAMIQLLKDLLEQPATIFM